MAPSFLVFASGLISMFSVSLPSKENTIIVLGTSLRVMSFQLNPEKYFVNNVGQNGTFPDNILGRGIYFDQTKARK